MRAGRRRQGHPGGRRPRPLRRQGPLIDLNADLAEGFGRWSLTDDETLLGLVTSANVACGFHAGDPATMRRVAATAVGRGVAIGAQVSYRDLAGFGRRAMDIDPSELLAELLYQCGALQAMARAAGGRVAYVKPHGALNHRVVADEGQAAALVEATALAGADLILVVPPQSAAARLAADAGLRVVVEGYPDRATGPDGRLLPRSRPGAVIEDPSEIARRAVELARSGEVQSLCIHGDSPGAVAAARMVRRALEDALIPLAPFSRP